MNKCMVIVAVLFCSLKLAAQDSLVQKNKDMIDQLKERISKIENSPAGKDPVVEIDRLNTQLNIKNDSIALLLKELKAVRESSPASNGKYVASANGNSLTFLFAQKETSLDYAALPELDELMRKYDGRQQIVIKGHADKSGLEYYNVLFSKERAKNLEAYIVKKYHIDPAKIKTQWLGSTQPVPATSELSKYHLNRRVEIMIR